MKKILAPTDFSPNSSTSFIYAYLFASTRKMNIDLLHLVVPQTETADFPMVSGHLTTNKAEIANEVMSNWHESIIKQIELKKGSYVPEVKTFVKVDYPVHGIKNFAEEGDYELVICGNRGEDIGAVDKIFGTVSEGLAQDPSCPILFIPEDYVYESIDFLGYGSSLSPSDPYELWRALELFAPEVPLTRFYHISSKSTEKIEKKKDELEKYLYNHNDSLQIIFYDVNSDEIDESLLEMIENYDLDVLVMTRRKQNFLERIFSKSHTASMLRKIDIPLLVMNQE
jgi:nucleotide-binding universal stress UspA family protein